MGSRDLWRSARHGAACLDTAVAYRRPNFLPGQLALILRARPSCSPPVRLRLWAAVRRSTRLAVRRLLGIDTVPDSIQHERRGSALAQATVSRVNQRPDLARVS